MRIKWGKVENHPGGYAKVTVVVDGDKAVINESLRNATKEDYDLEIKKVRKKRSLTANDYYHALVDKLAGVLRTTKEEVHEHLLRSYGTLKTDEDGHIKKLIMRSGEDPEGMVKYPVFLDSCTIDGEEYNIYGVSKGSSEMNSAEFARLLDGCISECKEQGIETIPKTEIERLIR